MIFSSRHIAKILFCFVLYSVSGGRLRVHWHLVSGLPNEPLHALGGHPDQAQSTRGNIRHNICACWRMLKTLVMILFHLKRSFDRTSFSKKEQKLNWNNFYCLFMRLGFIIHNKLYLFYARTQISWIPPNQILCQSSSWKVFCWLGQRLGCQLEICSQDPQLTWIWMSLKCKWTRLPACKLMQNDSALCLSGLSCSQLRENSLMFAF